MQIKWSLCLAVLLVLSATAKDKKKKKPSKWAFVRDMHKNLTDLWSKVQTLSNPVQISVHGMDDYEMDSPKKADSQNEAMEQKGTHVHIHFNLPPYPKSSHHEPEMKKGEDMTEAEEYTYATCDMKPMPSKLGHKVEGYIALRQKPSEALDIRVNLKGFHVPAIQRFKSIDMVSVHGLHVHQYADFQNGCLSFGGHFNPEGTTHGGPEDTVRHAGDWGNVVADRHGHIKVNLTDEMATLFGLNSIIGRGIVIHEKIDDLGQGGTKASLATGDAGGRVNCCVIGRTKGGPW